MILRDESVCGDKVRYGDIMSFVSVNDFRKRAAPDTDRLSPGPNPQEARGHMQDLRAEVMEYIRSNLWARADHASAIAAALGSMRIRLH